MAQFKWLKKSLVLEIKWWIPKPEVLNCVLHCFSNKKPAGFTKFQRDFSGAESATDDVAMITSANSNDVLDDREEGKSAYESMLCNYCSVQPVVKTALVG